MRVTVRCYRLRVKITGSDCLIDNSNCCNSGKYSPGTPLAALQRVFCIDPFLTRPHHP